MISRETIDEIKNRVDIVDVISDFVSLKRSGQNYKALSPFSNEKSPSFFVVPAKGIFKDFSSGKGGDAITFVMEHEGMTYVEALKFLGKKYGVEIQENGQSDEAREQQSEREGLYILMNFAKDYYKRNLFESEEGNAIGLSYFRERGFNDRTIEKFELGYALEGWNNLSEEAIKQNYNKDLLEKTGLVVRNEEGRTYDRFRGRVIFPVHNLSGKVIAFGARMMGKDKNQPKYINSPETEIYHKSNVLYGLYQAKNVIRQKDNCYLVEGYTDVLSMHQSDVENVVASSGTALTEEQIKLIKRFTENVTVLFDGDAAGIKAALRGIDLILKGGLNVRVVLLPDNDDPDSYSRKVGTSEFQKYLAQKSQDFISFKAGLFASESANDPIRKAESIKEIVGSIALIPDPIKRSVYLQETSQLLKISEPVLLTELNKLLIEEINKKKREGLEPSRRPVISGENSEFVEAIVESTQGPADERESLYYQEKETTRLLVKHGSAMVGDQTVAEYLIGELDDVQFVNSVYKKIFEAYRDALERGEVLTADELIASGSTEMKSKVAELLIAKEEISLNWKKKFIYIAEETELLSEMVHSNVNRLKFWTVRVMLTENKDKIKEAESLSKDNEVDMYLDERIRLKEAEQQLASVLGIVVAR